MMFQIGVAPVRVDLLTTVRGLRFSSAYKNAESIAYGDIPVKVLSLADLIRAKKAAGRPQDRLDLRRLKSAQTRRRHRGK